MPLMAADRRDSCRAALFLCTIFLSAMLSMIVCDCLKISAAAALSPASMALRTALTAVRRRERRLELWAFAATAWRARLRACVEFAMYLFLNSECAPGAT